MELRFLKYLPRRYLNGLSNAATSTARHLRCVFPCCDKTCYVARSHHSNIQTATEQCHHKSITEQYTYLVLYIVSTSFERAPVSVIESEHCKPKPPIFLRHNMGFTDRNFEFPLTEATSSAKAAQSTDTRQQQPNFPAEAFSTATAAQTISQPQQRSNLRADDPITIQRPDKPPRRFESYFLSGEYALHLRDFFWG